MDVSNLFDEFGNRFISDMQAFEKKYPNVHLIVETVEIDNIDKWLVNIDGYELFFDSYNDVVTYLNIY